MYNFIVPFPVYFLYIRIHGDFLYIRIHGDLLYIPIHGDFLYIRIHGDFCIYVYMVIFVYTYTW